MAKYFIDTEFIEGFRKPLFGKKRHFIDLISIGIVCDDGREFYRVSNEYNYNDADQWVRDNVIIPLYRSSLSGDIKNIYRANDLHKLIGMSNRRIAEEILSFFKCWRDVLFYRAPEGIEIYGYYSDYDWVVFCSLFGRMIDLPKGFPMYCIDLKQTLDEKANNRITEYSKLFDKQVNFDFSLNKIKTLSDYPKQDNEHNALSDAKWNKKLYQFLKTM